MPYYVYILQCADGSYYTGKTAELEGRLFEHQSGADPKAYTYNRRPVKLVWFDHFPTQADALMIERKIKGWSRAKKEALIARDWERLHLIVRSERQRREGP